MVNKRCSSCGSEKPLSAFGGPWGSSKDRFDSLCRPCKKTYNAAYYKRWADAEKDVVAKKACRSCARELSASQFPAHPGRPGGLSSDCKQCLAEKRRMRAFRAAHRQPLVVVSEKTCSACGETKPAEAFYQQVVNRDGLAYSCKPCSYARHSAARKKINVPEPTVEEKWCPGCMDFLIADDFHRNRRNKSGLCTYCKTCESDRKKQMRGSL